RAARRRRGGGARRALMAERCAARHTSRVQSARATEDEVDRLASLLAGRRVAILTGAGCSTESGIPDYRGPETRRRARDPVKYRAFLTSEDARERDWARAVVGWPRMAAARPNAAHHAIARMQRDGVASALVTQNVDRLHAAAGSDAVELHGALAEVRSMQCGRIEDREAVQARLAELNPGWAAMHAELAPDGDAELPAELVARFRLTGCLQCGGFLKPNVVFFGETVPREIVERAYASIDAAEALLVVGSSLAVFSGY